MFVTVSLLSVLVVGSELYEAEAEGRLDVEVDIILIPQFYLNSFNLSISSVVT